MKKRASMIRLLRQRYQHLGTGAGLVKSVRPGGLVAIGTKLDPTFTKSDSLIGSVVGKPGTLPKDVEDITIEVSLFDTAVGTAEMVKVEPLKAKEPIRLNIGTASKRICYKCEGQQGGSKAEKAGMLDAQKQGRCQQKNRRKVASYWLRNSHVGYMQILCDTSFLMVLVSKPLKRVAKIESQLGRLDFLVPDIVEAELERLAQNAGPKRSRLGKNST